MRAAGETETTQENIQEWLGLDEGDPRFQLIVFFIVLKSRLYSDIFLFIFYNITCIIKFSIYSF
jgi:hypothetical protein